MDIEPCSWIQQVHVRTDIGNPRITILPKEYGCRYHGGYTNYHLDSEPRFRESGLASPSAFLAASFTSPDCITCMFPSEEYLDDYYGLTSSEISRLAAAFNEAEFLHADDINWKDFDLL